MISVPCPRCQGQAIISRSDGRGEWCPTCKGEGFMLKKVREPFWVLLKRRWLRFKYRDIPNFMWGFCLGFGLVCEHIICHNIDKRKLERFLDDIIEKKEE